MGKTIYWGRHNSDSELKHIIEHADPEDPERLYLTLSLKTEKDMDHLLELSNKPQISIIRLRLEAVDPALIKTDKFKQLISKLDPDILRYLELNFTQETPIEAIKDAISTSGIADIACYPITVPSHFNEVPDKSFVEKIIRACLQFIPDAYVPRLVRGIQEMVKLKQNQFNYSFN